MCTCNIHAQVHPHTHKNTRSCTRIKHVGAVVWTGDIYIYLFIIILFRFYETASDQITGRGVYLARVSSLASEQAMSSCTRRRRRRLYNIIHEDRCKPFISHPRGSSSTVPKCVYFIYVINPVWPSVIWL